MQQISFHSELLLEYLVHQSRIRNKFCQYCLFVTRQLEDQPTLFTVQFSRSWFQGMRCANVRVSSTLKIFALAGASTLSTYTCSLGVPSMGLEGVTLLSPCLGGIFLFSLGCCCLFFWRVEAWNPPRKHPFPLPFSNLISPKEVISIRCIIVSLTTLL